MWPNCHADVVGWATDLSKRKPHSVICPSNLHIGSKLIAQTPPWGKHISCSMIYAVHSVPGEAGIVWCSPHLCEFSLQPNKLDLREICTIASSEVQIQGMDPIELWHPVSQADGNQTNCFSIRPSTKCVYDSKRVTKQDVRKIAKQEMILAWFASFLRYKPSSTAPGAQPGLRVQVLG